jgi:hypothetical protein
MSIFAHGLFKVYVPEVQLAFFKFFTTLNTYVSRAIPAKQLGFGNRVLIINQITVPLLRISGNTPQEIRQYKLVLET